MSAPLAIRRAHYIAKSSPSSSTTTSSSSQAAVMPPIGMGLSAGRQRKKANKLHASLAAANEVAGMHTMTII
jgi:hypothetical protein